MKVLLIHTVRDSSRGLGRLVGWLVSVSDSVTSSLMILAFIVTTSFSIQSRYDASWKHHFLVLPSETLKETKGDEDSILVLEFRSGSEWEIIPLYSSFNIGNCSLPLYQSPNQLDRKLCESVTRTCQRRVVGDSKGRKVYGGQRVSN